MLQFDAIDPRMLGQRLAEARKARGVTQEDVARFLGCSRPTYIGMEKGDRLAKPEEVVKLASYFGRKVHELVRPTEPVIDLQPHLRAVAEKRREKDRKELLTAIDELQRLAEDYRELEQIMGARMRYNYPPAVVLNTRIDVSELAESVAVQERRRLGLGDQPIINLRNMLEWDVGLRTFYGGLPSAIAGMYAYDTNLGGCILVNRKHPPERRRVSILHEYGHLIVDRFKPGIDCLSMSGRKPASERFAEAFALNFLMPASSVRQRFHDIVTTTGDFQVSDLSRLCHFYFVSVQAMTLRLEQLGLIPKGSWRKVKGSKFTPRQGVAMWELPSHPESPDVYPERYKYLAVRAFEQEKVSQGQLARLLRCDPVTAREIVAQCLTSSLMDDEGKEKKVRLEFQRSLLSDVM